MKITGAPCKNELINLRINVAASAKLPLSKVRGSAAARDALAAQYSSIYTQELDKLSTNNTCTVENFKKAIKNTLGDNNIKFNVLPVEADVAHGALSKTAKSETKQIKNNVYNVNSQISGYNFYFPLDSTNSVIKNKNITVHEARHFFDYICNPKTITIPTYKLINEKQRLKDFHKVYNSFLKDYTIFRSIKTFKKDVRTRLDKMPNEDAISVLQTVRHSMKSEINAYIDEHKYMRKNPVRNFYGLLHSCNYLAVMRYDKKLKFANELLAEKLKEAKSLKNNLEK